MSVGLLIDTLIVPATSENTIKPGIGDRGELVNSSVRGTEVRHGLRVKVGRLNTLGLTVAGFTSRVMSGAEPVTEIEVAVHGITMIWRFKVACREVLLS